MKIELREYEEKMQKSITSYEKELATIRAGQANPSVLSKVSFVYYGAPTPLNTMADIKAADARTIVISPFDPSTLKEMEKAILASDIGITPTNDGKVIRLIFPQLTGERRKELSKQVQKMGEEVKVAVRNVRRDANEQCKKMKKNGEMTEDEQKSSEKSIQDITDKYIQKIDEISAKKEKEIMSI